MDSHISLPGRRSFARLRYETEIIREVEKLETASNDSLPPFKCFDILCRQIKPLSFTAFVAKSAVPVCFDTDGVVGLNTVNRFRRYRNFDRELSLTTTHGDRSANFVMPPRLHQIYKAGHNFWLPAIPRARLGFRETSVRA